MDPAENHETESHEIVNLRIIFMASTPRTGSTLLSTGMHRSGLLGVPREYLNLARPNYRFREPTQQSSARLVPPEARLLRKPEVWIARTLSRGPISARAFTTDSWLHYLHQAVELRSTSNGVFSVKAHWNQYERNLLSLGLSADVWGTDITWIGTRRRNRIAQAISFYRALETGQWRPRTRLSLDRSEPKYSARAIERALENLIRQEDRWGKYFRSIGVEPYYFDFEDIAVDVDACVRKVAELVGVRLEDHDDSMNAVIRTRAPSTVAQEWEERFRSEKPRLVEELGL